MTRLLCALALVPAIFAQAPTSPPPILQIACEAGYEGTPAKPYSAAKAAVDVVGMAAVSGVPQTWTVELHNNFASIESLDQAIFATAGGWAPQNTYGQSEDLLTPPRSMIALYEPDWSYRPDEAARMLAKARYVGVTIYRIRLGRERDFEQLLRTRNLIIDSINLNRPEMAYRVVSGAPAGVYLLIAPLANLREMDDGVADVPAFAALSPEERAKAAAKQAEVEMGREHLMFRVDPRLSYVSDDFAAADQAFWRGRPQAQE